MFRTKLLAVNALLIVAAVGYATLQVPQTKPAAVGGQFSIVPHGQNPILIDHQSGKTWILMTEGNRLPAWAPGPGSASRA